MKIFFAAFFLFALVSCGKTIGEDELSIYNPATFTFYNGDLANYLPFTDPVAKEITARTGITLPGFYLCEK